MRHFWGCVMGGCAVAMAASAGRAEPLTLHGNAVEVVISQVTGRTVRVEVCPVDGAGAARPAPASTVFVPIETKEHFREVLRTRDSDVLARPLVVNGLQIVAEGKPLKFSFRRADGRVVQELAFRDADGSFSFNTPGPVFGMGEGRQQFDRRGFYYDFQNGQNQFLATHGATVAVPFVIGIDPEAGAKPTYWGMFVHNPALPGATAQANNLAWGQFDLRGEDAGPAPAPASNRRGAGGGNVNSLTPPAVLPTKGRYMPQAGMVDRVPMSIYVMNLAEPAEAVAEYTHLVGNPVMPPKWVMGYMQSHRSLASAEEIFSVAKKFRENQLPCDALIYLGTGYTNAMQPGVAFGGWNTGHGSLAFNPFVFPEPQKAIDALHGMNFKIVLHKNAPPAGLNGNVGDVNVAGDDRNAVANHWATHTPLVKMGIDAWWPDDGDDLGVENRLARIRMYYDGMLKDRPNERPWSLDRNGYASVARYGGWNWSGDVTSTWRTLQYHVPLGLNFSVSVSPWWGTDIGGFNGAAEYSGELYARWFQFGAFNPLFRSHGRNWQLHTPWGWNTGETGVRETALPVGANLRDEAVEKACKAALELRYALLPYNYSITREACDSGMPLMRPLWFYYADDAEARGLGDEYLWGPSLLVAPVIEQGAKVRKVYLPAGEWYDYWTGEKFAGKAWVEKAVDLGTIPLYVRAGAVVPVDPVRQFTGEKVAGPTTLRVFDGGDSTFMLYDDDGHTMGYQGAGDDQTQWVRCTWTAATRTLSLEPRSARKAWPAGMVRTFEVEMMPGGAKKRVEFSGTRVDLVLAG